VSKIRPKGSPDAALVPVLRRKDVRPKAIQFSLIPLERGKHKRKPLTNDKSCVIKKAVVPVLVRRRMFALRFPLVGETEKALTTLHLLFSCVKKKTCPKKRDDRNRDWNESWTSRSLFLFNEYFFPLRPGAVRKSKLVGSQYLETISPKQVPNLAILFFP